MVGTIATVVAPPSHYRRAPVRPRFKHSRLFTASLTPAICSPRLFDDSASKRRCRAAVMPEDQAMTRGARYRVMPGAAQPASKQSKVGRLSVR